MQMTSEVKTLLEEYCSLTGRPAATITVSEFLELRAVVQVNPVARVVSSPEKVEERGISNIADHQNVEIIEQPREASDAVLGKPVEREAHVIPKEAHAAPEVKEIATPKRQESKKPAGASNMENALAMLKSISG